MKNITILVGRNLKNLQVKLTVNFYSPKIENNFNTINADVVISINFVNLIPQDFINKFKYGIINSHLGDFPRYKGNACPNWAILNSEKSINLTLHKMNSELDSGPIVLKDKFFLKEEIHISDVYEWLNNRTPKLFEEAVKKIINGDKFDIQKENPTELFQENLPMQN